ncbi:MAG: prolipoprotein diacylglyceryl transferase [Chloroflexi bacterium]|nr:prolipoprotein diacylglyceryl transferase [Chloroflexota bacterium]
MKGIVIDINPVLLRVGHFEIQWYSIFVLLAVAGATVVALRRCKKLGISSDQVYNLVLLAAAGGIIGARLFHVLDHLEYYSQNPSQIIGFGGLAIWGALAGGGLAVFIYARAKKMPVTLLADAVVPAVLVGQIIGRFACIVNGDAYGGVTGLPWGLIYVNPASMIPEELKGIPTHPYVVYEQLWNALTLAGILLIEKRVKVPGFIFIAYISSYSVARFLLTSVRQETVLFWGLQEAQIVSLAVLAVTIPLLVVLFRKGHALPSNPKEATVGLE